MDVAGNRGRRPGNKPISANGTSVKPPLPPWDCEEEVLAEEGVLVVRYPRKELLRRAMDALGIFC